MITVGDGDADISGDKVHLTVQDHEYDVRSEVGASSDGEGKTAEARDSAASGLHCIVPPFLSFDVLFDCIQKLDNE